MIEICTYLTDGDMLYPIEIFKGNIDDPDYIEGAIELSVNNQAVLTIEMYDYVDQLWEYIVKGIISLQKNEYFSTYFPDQPIELIFKPDKERVAITVKHQSVVSCLIDKSEFINAMLCEAKKFFEFIASCNNIREDSYLAVLESITIAIEKNL
jgi:hypothetical protein